MADVSIEFKVSMNFNSARLVEGLYEAWPEVNELLSTQFTKNISRNIWPWPKGKSPRDIVDKGHLRSSYKGRLLTRDVYEHSWTAEYAMAVHEGAVINNAFGRGIRVILPARPWVRVTLREYNVARAYGVIAKRYLERLGGGQ